MRPRPALAVLLLLPPVLTGCAAELTADDPAPAARVATAPALDRVGSLLPGPGWTISDVTAFGDVQGEYEVDAGRGEVTITWRPAAQYDDYLADRSDVSTAEAATVLGAPARLFTYAPDDHTVLRAVGGDAFVELRASSLDRAGLDAFLAGLHPVTPREFTDAVDAAGLRMDEHGDAR